MMKIDHIEAINLRFEYESGFQYAGGTCTARVTTLVLVHTDTGHVGIGSIYSYPALAYLVVQQQLAPQLIGEDPTDVERLWNKMYQTTRWYGRKGAAMSALGGLDTAFWDLRGKAADKPVWRLMGGEQATCDAYASGLLWKEPNELAEEAAGMIDRGFRRVKMRLGYGEERDAASVGAVRQAIGDSCDVLVDGSMRYSMEAAEQAARMLKQHNVFWFEEPFQPEDIDSFVELRKRIDVPLAAGENEFGAHGFRELIRAEALDIVQPDACRCGGISEVKRVVDMATAANLRVATHSWSDAAAIVANAHVIGPAENGITVEVDQTDNPFIKELLVEPLNVVDGQLQLSEAPGLGIELNQAVVDRYRMKDPLAIPDGVYSDMVFGAEYALS